MLKADAKPINLIEPSVKETLSRLVTELKKQPAFIALIRAHQDFQADQQAQDLQSEARTLQHSCAFPGPM
jgi:hypothetical protein